MPQGKRSLGDFPLAVRNTGIHKHLGQCLSRCQRLQVLCTSLYNWFKYTVHRPFNKNGIILCLVGLWADHMHLQSIWPESGFLCSMEGLAKNSRLTKPWHVSNFWWWEFLDYLYMIQYLYSFFVAVWILSASFLNAEVFPIVSRVLWQNSTGPLAPVSPA